MTTIAVIGAAWGDEGKGKIVDTLAAGHKTVVRFAGGPNAGHTIYANGKKVILHLVPSSVTCPGTLNVVGPGVLCEPVILMEEINIAKTHGSTVLLDPAAHIITPWDVQLDKLREIASGSGALGTTGRGIGPCTESRTARYGIRLSDLTLHTGDLRKALLARHYAHERMAIIKSYGATPMTIDDMVIWCASFRSLTQHLCDTRAVVHKALNDGENVMFEGAQGVMLDLYLGTYPFVTSTNPTIGGIATTMGVNKVDRVIGVTKAYDTRVGNGPFPTEIGDEVADKIGKVGAEVGSTTGRPRRIGWLDLVALKYAIRMTGITELVLTKLDVLTGIDPIFVAMDYMLDDKAVDRYATLTTDIMSRSKPSLQGLEGWTSAICGYRKFSELPINAQRYVRFIEDNLKTPITMIGVGPERDAIIMR